MGHPQKASVWDARGPRPHRRLLPLTLGEERLGIPPVPHSVSKEGTGLGGAKGSRRTGGQAGTAQPGWSPSCQAGLQARGSPRASPELLGAELPPPVTYTMKGPIFSRSSSNGRRGQPIRTSPPGPQPPCPEPGAGPGEREGLTLPSAAPSAPCRLTPRFIQRGGGSRVWTQVPNRVSGAEFSASGAPFRIKTPGPFLPAQGQE